MSVRLKRCLKQLKILNSCSNCKRKTILNQASPDLIQCISEVAFNITKGNIPISNLQKRKLLPFKDDLRYLSKKSHTSLKQKRKVIQKGGFLPLILTPLLSVVGSILGEYIADNFIKRKSNINSQ
jgi:hypothetical protein